MSATGVALRAGLSRGWIETRLKLTSPWELLGEVWPWVIAVFVMFALRGSTVAGFSVGLLAIPGILGITVVYTGMLGLSLALSVEREDGTLLRMKAVPNGTLGYLVGKAVGRAGLTIACVLIVLVPAALLFDGLQLSSVTSWSMLAWVVALGLAATLPIGAIFGSLFGDPKTLGLVTLPTMGLIAISGIFYPIAALPVWLQWIGQAFPIYWLGLGMRSALLPDVMAAAEIGGSWRHLETVGVLGAWAVAGFVVAPVVLRRMARREPGTTVEAQQR